MKWEGTTEGERHNKEIWKVIRALEKPEKLPVRLFIEIKSWLTDLDQRISRIGVAGRLPVLFVELMLEDYADAANCRESAEGTPDDAAFLRIQRMCEVWGIDYDGIAIKYEKKKQCLKK